MSLALAGWAFGPPSLAFWPGLASKHGKTHFSKQFFYFGPLEFDPGRVELPVTGLHGHQLSELKDIPEVNRSNTSVIGNF